MENTLLNAFCWGNPDTLPQDAAPDAEYQAIARWAGQSRGQNPNAFDAVTAWILDDTQWTPEQLSANEQLLVGEIFARFHRQNAWLRRRLTELTPSGVVNPPVFDALNRFDAELSGVNHSTGKPNAIAPMLADFSVMLDPAVRRQIAGEKTGPCGTDSVDLFGCINELKDCDAAVQWTLFMPYVVKDQQKGFRVKSFEYKKMPAMRFVGREEADESALGELFATLDALNVRPLLEGDMYFYHHHGRGVDVDGGQGLWGRFLEADAPVPAGFTAIDFLPEYTGGPGTPYLAHFAYAVFEGNHDAMHENTGFDVDAMYDITRNIMLAQNVPIPYPEKYWTAGVCPQGYKTSSTAYMFSALL